MPLGLFLFFWWSLAPDLRFSLGQTNTVLVVSSATQVRARILSDRNIFCTLGEGHQRRGLMPLVLFLFEILTGYFSINPSSSSSK